MNTIKKEVLDNGLTILTEQMPHVRSISMGIWLKIGSRSETSELNGISHFIEHMLFKGTSNPVGRGYCAVGRFDRRQSRRVHRQRAGLLQHQGPRPASADRRSGLSGGSGPGRPKFAQEDIEKEESHPRRNQDGGRQPRLPGA